jgi:transcriptional regulator with XRE-family HTH domain
MCASDDIIPDRMGYYGVIETDTDEGTWRIDRAVRAARERRGWTREALAFYSGLSWSAIAQIESGRRSLLRPASLSALAGALDVTVDYLLGRVSSPDAAHLKHRVLRYATMKEFLATVLPCFDEGMARGDPLLAVTTPKNGRVLRREFATAGRQLRTADSGRWYQSLTGALDAYRRFIDEKIDAGASSIRIIGEPVWSDPSTAEIDSWTRYEALINIALAGAPAEVICVYNTVTTPVGVLAGVDETHPETLDAGGVRTTAHYDPYDVLLRPPPFAEN